MSVRGKRVAVAKVKNGVLHIVAPLDELALKRLKQPVNLVYPKKEAGLHKKENLDNPLVNLDE